MYHKFPHTPQGDGMAYPHNPDPSWVPVIGIAIHFDHIMQWAIPRARRHVITIQIIRRGAPCGCPLPRVIIPFEIYQLSFVHKEDTQCLNSPDGVAATVQCPLE